MKYPKYPTYKDSGIEWLGEVPEHWEYLPLKRVSSIQLSNVDKKTVDDQQPVYLCNYVDVYKNERILADIPFMLASASDEQISRLSLKQCDVIITKDSESPDDIGVPALVSEDLTGVVCGYHLALIRPEVTVLKGSFLFRFFQGSFARAQFSLEAVGMTRFGLSKSSITDSKITVPPLSEQVAISIFLDRETAKIDALIAKQERLIALLQEKRQALISHAVTKGLNPDTPMKDSRLEWLGEIPVHWEVVTIRRHFDAELGKMLNLAKQDGSGTAKPYLRAANIHWDRLELDDVNEMEFSDNQLERYKLQLGDLLVTEGGVTVGRSAIWNGEFAECYYQNSLNRVRTLPGSPLSTRYLLYWMYFMTSNGFVDLVADKATFGHLTNEKLKAFPLVAPQDEHEQAAIVDFLDRETTQIDNLIVKVQQAVVLLQERRSALISATVTGKIDVRNMVS